MEDTQGKERFMCESQGGSPKRCRDLFGMISSFNNFDVEQENVRLYRRHFMLSHRISASLDKAIHVLRAYGDQTNRPRYSDKELVFVVMPLLGSNFNTIKLLCSQGYPLEALMISRSLIERAIDFAFIITKGGDYKGFLAEQYLKHSDVECRDVLQFVKQEGKVGDDSEGIDERINAIERNMEPDLKKYLDEHKNTQIFDWFEMPEFRSWWKLNWRKMTDEKCKFGRNFMAEQLERRLPYKIEYKIYSKMIHSSSASSVLLTNNLKAILIEPTNEGVGKVLERAIYWSLNNLVAYNIVFNTFTREEILELAEEWKKVYDSNIQAEPEP